MGLVFFAYSTAVHVDEIGPKGCSDSVLNSEYCASLTDVFFPIQSESLT